MRTLKIEQLRDVLIMRKTHFEYKKRDGTIEHAYGTLQYSFIPDNMYIKKQSEDAGFRYYNLYENDWGHVPEYVTEINVLSE